jgi:glycosyl hydrolase family 28
MKQCSTPSTYAAATGLEPSSDYRVRVNGREIFVRGCEIASVAWLPWDGEVEVEVESARDFREAVVRPLSRGISLEVEGRTLRFTLSAPGYLSVELDGDIRRPLFLFADERETDIPDPADPDVIFFEGGKVHDAGIIEMRSGQTLYLAEGAVVRGAVLAENAENVCIRGRGVLDGTAYREPGVKRVRMVSLVRCTNVRLEGITVFNSPSWSVVPAGCRGVRVRNVKIVTWGPCCDGFDIVGSEDVTVEDCFARTKDDCVAVKAVSYHDVSGDSDVRNVRVENCVFWNAEWGNAIEIGYETRCDCMSDILFRNLDIIHVEEERYSSGATISIHNGDRAVVRDVRFEDIRVEDSREKLIDLKVLFAQYSKDDQRGHIRDIVLKDLHVVDGPIPVSILQGYDGDHMIHGVTIENLRFHGRAIDNATDARMVTERADGIRFVVPQE